MSLFGEFIVPCDRREEILARHAHQIGQLFQRIRLNSHVSALIERVLNAVVRDRRSQIVIRAVQRSEHEIPGNASAQMHGLRSLLHPVSVHDDPRPRMLRIPADDRHRAALRPGILVHIPHPLPVYRKEMHREHAPSHHVDRAGKRRLAELCAGRQTHADAIAGLQPGMLIQAGVRGQSRGAQILHHLRIAADVTGRHHDAFFRTETDVVSVLILRDHAGHTPVFIRCQLLRGRLKINLAAAGDRVGQHHIYDRVRAAVEIMCSYDLLIIGAAVLSAVKARADTVRLRQIQQPVHAVLAADQEFSDQLFIYPAGSDFQPLLDDRVNVIDHAVFLQKPGIGRAEMISACAVSLPFLEYDRLQTVLHAAESRRAAAHAGAADHGVAVDRVRDLLIRNRFRALRPAIDLFVVFHAFTLLKIMTRGS